MQRQFQDHSFWTSNDRICDSIAAVMNRIFIGWRVLPATVVTAGQGFCVKREERLGLGVWL